MGIVELGLVIGADVEGNREAVRRVHSRTRGVQGELPNLPGKISAQTYPQNYMSFVKTKL